MKHLMRKLWLAAGISLFSLCTGAQEVANTSPTEVQEAWYIHFKTGKSNLEQDYNGNAATLKKFITRVHDILEQQEFTIKQIRITGYASPDGPVSLNERLSEERAQTLRKYLLETTGLEDGLFTVVAGGENWDELCIMIENSDLEQKEQILDIIRNSPQGTDPERGLKQLPGGVYRNLLQNFYPKLRSASSVQLLREIPVTAPPVVQEVEVAAKDTTRIAPQKPAPTEPAPCRCDPPLLGIKTNLLGWAALITPNLEIEAYFARRFSFGVEGDYRWLKDSRAKGNTYNWARVSPELRMYLRPDATWQGHYFGLYGQYSEYDVKMGHIGRQGKSRGLGLSYGYVFKFHRWDCFYLDLGIAAGYNRLSYDRYSWYDPCNPFEGHKGKNYWGPTKLKASLVWRF